jgi:predicted transcriptional regulator
MDRTALLEIVRRAPALEVLSDAPATPRDLVDELDVSRSTVQRLTNQLAEKDLVERRHGEVALTPAGAVAADELRSFESRVKAACEHSAALAAFHDLDYDFPAHAFADAARTEAVPEDPYRPVKRFMSLLEETETLRGIDPTAVNPLHIDDLQQAIVDGMETDAVLQPEVVSELLANNPKRAQEAFDTGNLTLRLHEDLTFGLTLCDHRVGVGIYDEDTWMLELYVDTADPEAYEWGEDVFADVRAAAEVVDWRAELPQR